MNECVNCQGKAILDVMTAAQKYRYDALPPTSGSFCPTPAGGDNCKGLGSKGNCIY